MSSLIDLARKQKFLLASKYEQLSSKKLASNLDNFDKNVKVVAEEESKDSQRFRNVFHNICETTRFSGKYDWKSNTQMDLSLETVESEEKSFRLYYPHRIIADRMYFSASIAALNEEQSANLAFDPQLKRNLLQSKLIHLQALNKDLESILMNILDKAHQYTNKM